MALDRPMVQPPWINRDKPRPEPVVLDIEGTRAIAEKHRDVLPWWLSYELVPLCDYALALEAAQSEATESDENGADASRPIGADPS